MKVLHLKTSRNLSLEDLAEILGCSKGHASDLCTGRRRVTVAIAKRLGDLTGTPWHEWIEADQPAEASAQGAA